MKTMSVTTTIEAPARRVFEVFADLRNAAGRVKGITALEVLTEGPIGKGTRFRETRKMFGREATETMEILEFEPDRGYLVGGESCGMRWRSTFDFVPEAGGERTRVTMTFAATPLTLMAKLMSPLSGMMTKACRKMLERDLADLKGAAEAGS
ncbi:MAG: SRPBCC family protein [Phycisphaerales bacterium]|nr:SRPBCC family protein [Phycisphaerales bacterium]